MSSLVIPCSRAPSTYPEKRIKVRRGSFGLPQRLPQRDAHSVDTFQTEPTQPTGGCTSLTHRLFFGLWPLGTGDLFLSTSVCHLPSARWPGSQGASSFFLSALQDPRLDLNPGLWGGEEGTEEWRVRPKAGGTAEVDPEPGNYTDLPVSQQGLVRNCEAGGDTRMSALSEA